MAKLLNKMLNLVGWETEEEEEEIQEETAEEKYQPPQYLQTFAKKPQNNKIVNIHSNNQFKVVIMQPDSFDDAREVCDQLKNKKPVVVNLEGLTKETAQRVIDFLSGSVYALTATQGIGRYIHDSANVDIMSNFREDIRSKVVFPWVK